jgi:hypothetical protein
MSTEENKALIRRYIAHNPPIPRVSLDRDGLKQAAETFRVATPGTHELPPGLRSTASATGRSSSTGQWSMLRACCSRSARSPARTR